MKIVNTKGDAPQQIFLKMNSHLQRIVVRYMTHVLLHDLGYNPLQMNKIFIKSKAWISMLRKWM